MPLQPDRLCGTSATLVKNESELGVTLGKYVSGTTKFRVWVVCGQKLNITECMISSLLSVLMAALNLCPLSPCKKPLSPSCTVQMSDTKASPMPIPLLAAVLGADTRTVMLAYGNHLQPVMEKVVSTLKDTEICSVT